MTGNDFSAELRDLNATLDSVTAVLDLDALTREKNELEAAALAPDLWDDVTHAQKVTSRLSYVQNELNRVANLRRRLDDAEVLWELAASEGDSSATAEAGEELADLRKSIEELEVRTLLSGEYDEREALVSIRSGAGGADSADFAEQLMRMYLRWSERHGYPTEVYDVSYAEEAGIKSATFAVKAPYAYGTLAVEQGTHRVVRISKYDNQGRRQTAFAAVEVVPVVEQTDDIEIPDDEIRVDVYRSSGPGGQGVNTTDSAVRITHLETGIVVSCQNERSQLQNRATAMGVLKAKLLQRKRDEEQAKMDELRGSVAASWGEQMRSYVQHPYQMVKDLRTGWESANVMAVYDGEIDGLIEAGIRWRKQQENRRDGDGA
ncbi:peptide chain release factor 2 [Stackebrandtia albiflava]|uniref:peptide chain release factor 2 n=1 Tax=Stackebrandtia albiflava TaxID=406432 RepID=UPI001B884723|nr:peptide chain release factor 2 [Stackebrandtia albiflava]